MGISDVKKRRYQYLYRLWESSEEDSASLNDPWEIGTSLKLNLSETQKIVSYLMGENLIEVSKDGGIVLTSKGLDEVKSSTNNLQKAITKQQENEAKAAEEDEKAKDAVETGSSDSEENGGELNLASLEPYFVGLALGLAGIFSVIMGVSYLSIPPILVGIILAFASLVCLLKPEIYETAVEDVMDTILGDNGN